MGFGDDVFVISDIEARFGSRFEWWLSWAQRWDFEVPANQQKSFSSEDVLVSSSVKKRISSHSRHFPGPNYPGFDK